MTADRVAALAVGLAPLLYFLPATRGRLVLCPDDGVLFNLPLRVAAAQITLDGHWPLWNPYLFGGMPLLGAAQAGLLLPLNWFFLFFSAPVAMNLTMFASYGLAGAGAFLYARRAGTSIAGALATGFVWQWSGFMVAQIGHTNVVQVACLLPWLLWSIDVYGQTGRRAWGAAVAIFVALQTFAGHQQTLAYSLLLAAAYAAYMGFHATGRVRRHYFLSWLLVVVGVLLAAAQILPTLELTRNSVRAAASYSFFTSFSLPPQFLLTFLAPYVVGGGDGTLFRAPYTGEPFYGEYIGYAGVASVMLALVAVLVKRDRQATFWGVVALVALALALGRFWPFKLYAIVYYIPIINLFRVPARHMMEVDFALAVLAGRGLTILAAKSPRGRTLMTIVVISVLVLLLAVCAVTVWRPADFRLARQAPVTLLRAPELFLPIVVAALSAWALWRLARGRRGATSLLLVILMFDLVLWGQMSGWRAGSPSWEHPLWQVPEAVKQVRERGGESAGRYRVLTSSVPLSLDASALAVSPGSQPFRFALQPDIYMMHGVQNAAGYDGFGLARYSRLAGDMKVWGDFSEPKRSLFESRELDLLNVRYLIAPPPAHTGPVDTLPVAEQHGGYGFAGQNLDAPHLSDGAGVEFTTPRLPASRVALLTNLSWSVGVPDGTTVARLRLWTDDGRTFDFDVRAGQDSSEWAYDRPIVKSQIRHSRAPVATTFKVDDPSGDYEGHAYVASFALPAHALVVGGRIEVARLAEAPQLGLSLLRLSFIDEASGQTFPLRKEWLGGETAPTEQEAKPAARWRRVAHAGDVVVYENTLALPRAWLATEAVTQPDETTLEVVRAGAFHDGRAWDPRRTVLLDVPLTEQYGQQDDAAHAEVTRYEPNRIDVKTSSAVRSILVLSENHYPGWRATVDGRAVETMRVNYNLRGVALLPGEHDVRFVYRPKSVIFGVLISLLAAAGLFVWCMGWADAWARPLMQRLEEWTSRRSSGLKSV